MFTKYHEQKSLLAKFYVRKVIYVFRNYPRTLKTRELKTAPLLLYINAGLMRGGGVDFC